jgi:hypothetical protein
MAKTVSDNLFLRIVQKADCDIGTVVYAAL